MSLILDALKKAEKDRNAAPNGANEYNPFVPNSQKKKSLVPVLLVLVVIAGAGYGYLKFFKKPDIPANIPQPMALIATPAASQPLSQGNNPEALKEKALLAFSEGDYDASKEVWEKLTLLTPTDPEIYNNLGVVEKKRGDKEAAKKAYRKALDLKPDYAQALNNYGVVLMENQAYDQSRELFMKALEAKIDYAEPYFHLALLAESIGDNKQAIEQYQKFIDRSPDLNSKLKTEIEMRLASLKGL